MPGLDLPALRAGKDWYRSRRGNRRGQQGGGVPAARAIVERGGHDAWASRWTCFSRRAAHPAHSSPGEPSALYGTPASFGGR